MNAQEMKHASPVVVRKHASWDGIKLEYYRFRKGELPEHSHREHMITFSPSGSCNGVIRMASGFEARGQSDGSVCVIPSGHPFSAELAGDTEQLAIYLDPSLVLQAAGDSLASGRAPEVIESCSANDPVVRSVGLALLAELEAEAPSGRLYAESLANLLAIHVLRHYTSSQSDVQRFKGGL